MTYYAIRKRNTDLYLPLAGSGTQTRGFTWVEPTNKLPPRLFLKPQYANSALTHWLRGKLTPKYDSDFGEYIGNSLERVPTRNKSDFEIVVIQLLAPAHAAQLTMEV